ncbi:MAG: hypothetical protein IMHGJWDQ_001739 [Candidatus Fervidibacter sp.]
MAERPLLEGIVRQCLQERLMRSRTGIEVVAVRLQDVHPPIEVVDAFRKVASALEEKEASINQAEAYRNAQIPMARGKAGAQLKAADAYKWRRIWHAAGEAYRWQWLAEVYRQFPEVTRIRLYLEAIEQALAGKPKVIMDARQVGRKQYSSWTKKGLPFRCLKPCLPCRKFLPPRQSTEGGMLMTAEKRKWVRFGLALLAILLGGRCFFTVDETEWALVVRFGRVVRVVKEAGLHFRLPMDSVRKFDKRLQIYNPPATEFLTGDKKNLVLDVFVVWRVADPLRFLQSVGDTVGAEARLHDLVWSELAATLGNYELTQLVCVRPEGERNGKSAPLAALTDTVWERCRVTARRLYGIELVDVRLKRLLFPEQNREAVFARMRAERERIAQRYLAEGVLHRRER